MWFLSGNIYSLRRNWRRGNGNSEKAIEYALEAKKYAKTRGNKIDTEIFLASLYNRHMRYTEAEEILRPIISKN